MPLRELQFNDLREAAKEELSTQLGKIAIGGDKKKAVLVQSRLRQSLEATGLAAAAFTEANGVKYVHNLDVHVPPATDVLTVVIIVPPSLPLMKDVATIINRWNSVKQSLKFHVLFLPKQTFICCHMLENEYRLREKFGKRLEIDEIGIDLFLVEEDVLSMEQPTLFRELFMEGDTTALQYIAKALVKLQTAKIGLVPKIYSKGNIATRTLEFMRRMISDVGLDYMQEQASHIDRMLIIDRSVDLATPMVTQLTYEGLIDENFGLVCGSFEPKDFEVQGMKPQHNGKVPLNSSVDEIYESLRDLNFTRVGYTLHQKSLSVKDAYDRRKELQIREFGDFLRRVPEQHRLVQVHTSIAKVLNTLTQAPAFRRRVEMEHNVIQNNEEKEVLEYVDDLLNKGEPMVSVLRFICLLSLCNNGLKPKMYDQLRESFLLSYGIPQTLAGWYNLERAELLTKNNAGLLDRAGLVTGLGGGAGDGKAKSAPFSTLRKACRLWVQGLDEQAPAPTDVGYAYSGYAPLLLRVIEGLADYSERRQPSNLRAQGGDRAAGSAAGGGTRSGLSGSDGTSTRITSTGIPALDLTPGDMDAILTGAECAGSSKAVLVVVVGGITSAEISAIRQVIGTESAVDPNKPRTQYVVAATSITTGASILQSVLPFDP